MDGVVASHLLNLLNHHRNPIGGAAAPHLAQRPLIVGIQGPQGSGKTFLSAQLKSRLSSPPHNLSLAVLSLDDLYLPHDGLSAIAARIPPNPLWAGRGLPGTHDVDLGSRILQAVSRHEQLQSESTKSEIALPVFDKSLHNGSGDRLPRSQWPVVRTSNSLLDLVLLEGWCLGFESLSEDELDRRWDTVWPLECCKLRAELDFDFEFGKIDIARVNEELKGYQELWKFFDVFIQINPLVDNNDNSAYSIVYEWRLEQERCMKSQRGARHV